MLGHPFSRCVTHFFIQLRTQTREDDRDWFIYYHQTRQNRPMSHKLLAWLTGIEKIQLQVANEA